MKRTLSIYTVFLFILLFRAILSFRSYGLRYYPIHRSVSWRRHPSVAKWPLQTVTDASETIATLSFDWNEQWYPVLPISYFDDDQKPTAITILGKQLVVWKNEGSESGWSIFKDSCPHRRSPLSTGQVVKNGSTCSLMCRYHGWEFDAVGRCIKIPMNPKESDDQETKYPYKVASFPTKVSMGLLWVYLGQDSKNNPPPDIPAGALPSDADVESGSWEFFHFPMSYLSMTENSLDPAHALFTHQKMVDFGNRIMSPDDALPMARYEVIEANVENGGFSLEHTPFQRSTATRLGENSITTRTFIPPCTIISSSGFFAVKIWFVPSTPRDTNVLAVFMEPEPKIMKVTAKLPKVHSFLSDCFHSRRHWGDFNYRFQNQDRITMQGQDQRKPKDGYWWDLTPTPSDAGVAAFQKWIRQVGGYGPFPLFSTAAGDVIPGERSLWDSHAKYCPQCRRTIKRIATIGGIANIWSTRLLLASVISSVLAGIFAIASRRERTIFTATFSLTCLVAAVGSRWISEWANGLQRRVYADGGDNWQKRMETYGYFKQ